MSADPMPTIKDILGYPQVQPAADPIGELIERAENAGSPEHGLVWAQIATARAIQAQTLQQRIGNKLTVAHIDAITSFGDTPEDFRIRGYLTNDEWLELDS